MLPPPPIWSTLAAQQGAHTGVSQSRLALWQQEVTDAPVHPSILRARRFYATARRSSLRSCDFNAASSAL